MASFLDNCDFNATSTGTVDFVVATAVTGHQTPALAGAVNAAIYRYYARSADLSQWEEGFGAYTVSGTTLARTTVLFNSAGTGTGTGQSGAGSKISFSTVPLVAIVALGEDMVSIDATTGAFTISGLLARSSQDLRVLAAAKSDQTTATSNTVAVTPLHQQDHDSAAKAWCLFSGTATGTNAPTAGYNVTSVTRNSAGDYTVNFTTAFASANYVCQATSVNSANNTFMEVNGSVAPTASAIHLFAVNSFAGAVADPVSVMVVCYGRQ